MANIKYLLFRGIGSKQRLRDDIRSAIREFRLGMEVQSLKFEGGGGCQFYYGLGLSIDNVYVTAPSARVLYLLDYLKIKPIKNTMGRWFFENEEISKSFLKDNFEYESFLEPIKFESSSLDLDEDLFTYHEDDLIDDNSQDDTMMNHLLWWCSAKGDGSLRVFKDTAKLLWPQGFETYGSRSLMRKLLLLGDIEIVKKGQTYEWGIPPTTIVNSSYAGAYITGKMTPSILKNLHGAIKTGSHGGPTRIVINLPDVGNVFPVIEKPSEKISEALPSYLGWIKTLPGEPDIESHNYSFRIYNGRDFVATEGEEICSGFYEAKRIEGNHPPKVVVFNGTLWIGGAFYDLRWLARKVSGVDMSVYITKDGTLLVPNIERWPLLYERPLVLASGLLPLMKSIEGKDILVYASVGRAVAEVLTKKLELNLIEA